MLNPAVRLVLPLGRSVLALLSQCVAGACSNNDRAVAPAVLAVLGHWVAAPDHPMAQSYFSVGCPLPGALNPPRNGYGI